MPPADNGSGKRFESGQAIADRAEELRSKLSANPRARDLPKDLQQELLEFFDGVVQTPEDTPELGKLAGFEPQLETFQPFEHRNLRFKRKVKFEHWPDYEKLDPWRAMRKLVDETRANNSAPSDKSARAVRVVGECWGMSRLARPKRGGGLLVTNTWQPPARVGWADPAKKDAVRCHLGATFRDVQAFLRDTGKRLPNQPGFDGLTVAGVVGTGGHGSGLQLGSIATLVSRMELAEVEGDGRKEYVRGQGAFATAVTHLGRLGPVLSIDLDVVPKFHIAETRTIHRVSRSGLADLLEEAKADQLRTDEDVHSVEIWIAPYADDDGLHTVAYGKRVRTQDPIQGERPLALRSGLMQKLGGFLVGFIDLIHKPWIKCALHRTVEATETRRIVLDAADGLDFGAPNGNPMTSMEMAVRLEDGAEAAQLLLNTLEDLTHDDQYVFSPVGLRFVGKSAIGGLSPHAGRDGGTLHLEVPTFKDKRLGGKKVLTEVQNAMAKSGLEARPHWGQRVELDAETLAPLWPREYRAELRELIAEVDPKRVFASPLLDKMLRRQA